ERCTCKHPLPSARHILIHTHTHRFTQTYTLCPAVTLFPCTLHTHTHTHTLTDSHKLTHSVQLSLCSPELYTHTHTHTPTHTHTELSCTLQNTPYLPLTGLLSCSHSDCVTLSPPLTQI